MTDNQASIQDAIKRYDAAMADIGTCGDGNCVILKPIGMHTNGGCRCSTDRYKAQRAMMHGKILADAVRKVVAG